MTTAPPPLIAVEPQCWRRPALVDAVEAAGSSVVDGSEAVGLIWADPAAPELLETVLAEHDNIAWVQLPYAGIEPYLHLLRDGRQWTCGKGVYAEPVAEMALTMLLAGFRGFDTFLRATTWEAPRGRELRRAAITIVGGGGITGCLLPLLEPFGCDVTVVRNRPSPLDGADRVVGSDGLHDALATADGIVLALALTPETTGLIGADELGAMRPHSWLVNVARGAHVRTDALVDALRAHDIGGAALDVTDPEPLPDDHPLWSLPNCIITPHVGNTPEMGLRLLADRVTENVRRFGAGEELLGPVHPDLGY
ncbi:MAG: D-isomer specific 2-hydroxyacid dehydrogenase family protein [Acidimicrobiia bacterium]|nr:D-isomer specific 2-hydroxyacid dehydrogenase family protein [Acidimicrobiia bacterium]